MKHRVKTHKIGRDCKHRKALLNNLATSILIKGLNEDQMERSVTTTLARAKAVRGLVERLITYAKKGDLTAKRMARKSVNNREAFKGLFDSLNERYKDRVGGYTRILKLSSNRHGDNAEMAMISLVEDEIKSKPKKKSKEKKAQGKPAAKRANASKPKTELAEKPGQKPEGKSAEKTKTQAEATVGKAKANPEAENPPENKAEKAKGAPKPKKPAEKKAKKVQGTAETVAETPNTETKEEKPSVEAPEKSEAEKPTEEKMEEEKAEKKKEDK